MGMRSLETSEGLWSDAGPAEAVGKPSGHREPGERGGPGEQGEPGE